MKFRHDINALRAIAVIGVVLFHFKVPFFEGGFSGVDIFYVISGFLMTSIIIKSLDSNTFSFGEFYMKRVKRIVPALVCLILFLLVIGFFVYLPRDYKILTKNSAVSLAFVSNIFYYKSDDYFARASETNPLLHTWSLSVEWQFYLILPLILVIAHRFIQSNRNKYFWFFSISTIAIFILSVWYNKVNPSASFYLLPTRSWEMLAGGLAVFVPTFTNKKVGKFLAIAGYLGLSGCIFFLNKKLNWPGVYTSIPVIATFLVIIGNWNSLEFLQNKFVQWIGKLSYSIYLWHWPLFVFANYLGVQSGWLSTCILIILSGSLAYLSYTYIESVKLNGRKILLNTAALMVIAAIFTKTTPNRVIFFDKTLEISNYEDTHSQEINLQFGTDSCFIFAAEAGFKDFDIKYCLNILPDKKNILLFGDSHAAHLSQSMRELFGKQNINLVQACATGCLPLINKNGAVNCNEIIDYVYKFYLPDNSKKIDGVVISAHWLKVGKAGYSDLKRDLNQTIEYLDSLHIKSIIIGQTETYTISYPSIVAREYQYELSFDKQFINEDGREINNFLSRDFPNSYVDVYQSIKTGKLSSDKTPYMFDHSHFTKYGADKMILNILENKNFEAFLNSPDEQLLGSVVNN